MQRTTEDEEQKKRKRSHVEIKCRTIIKTQCLYECLGSVICNVRIEGALNVGFVWDRRGSLREHAGVWKDEP